MEEEGASRELFDRKSARKAHFSKGGSEYSYHGSYSRIEKESDSLRPASCQAKRIKLELRRFPGNNLRAESNDSLGKGGGSMDKNSEHMRKKGDEESVQRKKEERGKTPANIGRDERADKLSQKP